MDHQLFEVINGLAGKNNTLDQVMIFLSSYLLYAIVAFVLIMLFLKRYRQVGILGIGSIIVCLTFNFLFSFIYFRDRPFVQGDVNLLIEKGISASFPSDQATVAFAAAATFLFFRKKISGVFLFVLAISLGFSRIYVGHHYPGDILGGFIVGSCITFSLFKLIQRKKADEFTKKEEEQQVTL